MDADHPFLQIYGTLPRAGPGGDEHTRRAYGLLRGLPAAPRVLDLGCGPGAQTVELLRLGAGSVVALDILVPMLARTEEAAARAGMGDRLETLKQDMAALELPPGSFDLVWCEGAVYFLGFERGLERLRELVRPGGGLAVSEAVWLRPDPPAEAVEFWRDYPEIDTVENKRAAVARAGLELLGDFVLPPSAWTEAYYGPMSARIAEKEAAWAGDAEARSVLAEAKREIAMFEQHGASYGYAFFVMRRPSAPGR
jgi:SAM-dependent methyltransferase